VFAIRDGSFRGGGGEAGVLGGTKCPDTVVNRAVCMQTMPVARSAAVGRLTVGEFTRAA